MGVRVVHKEQSEAYSDGDYVRVSTCSDPNDDTVTLATIQRITEKLAGEKQSDAELRVKTLVMAKPMSPDDALGFATRYAERKRIPVVYAEMDDSEPN